MVLKACQSSIWIFALKIHSQRNSEKIIWHQIKNVFSFLIFKIWWWFKFNFRHFLGGNCIFPVCAMMFYTSKRACFLFVIFWAACLIRPLFSGNNCPHTVESVFDIFSQQRKARICMRHFIHTIHETSLSSMKKASLDGTFLCKSKKKGWRRWEFVRRQERNGRWKYKYVLAEY